jgi:hypothetical protein
MKKAFWCRRRGNDPKITIYSKAFCGTRRGWKRQDGRTCPERGLDHPAERTAEARRAPPGVGGSRPTSASGKTGQAGLDGNQSRYVLESAKTGATDSQSEDWSCVRPGLGSSRANRARTSVPVTLHGTRCDVMGAPRASSRRAEMSAAGVRSCRTSGGAARGRSESGPTIRGDRCSALVSNLRPLPCQFRGIADLRAKSGPERPQKARSSPFGTGKPCPNRARSGRRECCRPGTVFFMCLGAPRGTPTDALKPRHGTSCAAEGGLWESARTHVSSPAGSSPRCARAGPSRGRSLTAD